MKRFLALLLAMLMALSLAACGAGKGDPDSIKGEEKETAGSDAQSEVPGAQTAQEAQSDLPQSIGEASLTPLTAEKIGSMDQYEHPSLYQGGAIYRNGLYGVASLDGSADTGAKYTDCTYLKYNYFEVETTDAENDGSPETMNRVGVVNGEGREILPPQYALVQVLNNRYILTVTVSAITDSQDECVMYTTDRLFSMQPEEGDTLYAGTWQIFDALQNRFIPNVGGTKGYSPDAYGPYVSFRDDDEQRRAVDGEGKAVSLDAVQYRSEDFIAYEGSSEGKLIDSEGNTVFTYDPNEFSIVFMNLDGSFTGRVYKDGKYAYVVIDRTGEIVSAEFASIDTVVNGMIKADGHLYRPDGRQIDIPEFTSLNADKLTGDIWIAQTGEDAYTVFDRNGMQLWSTASHEGAKVQTWTMQISNDDGKIYSFADGDFTIEGYTVFDWLVKTDIGNGRYALVDARFNTELLKGYENYSCIRGLDDLLYVFAARQEGGCDIYTLS